MSKRDYECVARVVAAADVDDDTRFALAHNLADCFVRENSRFDITKFVLVATTPERDD